MSIVRSDPPYRRLRPRFPLSFCPAITPWRRGAWRATGWLWWRSTTRRTARIGRTTRTWLTNEAISEWHGVVTDGEGRVKRLLLGHNELSGEIPASLGNLTNLRYLELYSDGLSGEIPTELGNLANLQKLHLGSNELSGTIPVELGDLTRG